MCNLGIIVANDISLAVGDGRRRMTYAELAVVRGISAASAERLVRRRHWVRQLGNDGIVRVFVPLTETRNPRKTAAPDNVLSAPGSAAHIAPLVRGGCQGGYRRGCPGTGNSRRDAVRAIDDRQ